MFIGFLRKVECQHRTEDCYNPYCWLELNIVALSVYWISSLSDRWDSSITSMNYYYIYIKRAGFYWICVLHNVVWNSWMNSVTATVTLAWRSCTTQLFLQYYLKKKWINKKIQIHILTSHKFQNTRSSSLTSHSFLHLCPLFFFHILTKLQTTRSIDNINPKFKLLKPIH